MSRGHYRYNNDKFTRVFIFHYNLIEKKSNIANAGAANYEIIGHYFNV